MFVCVPQSQLHTDNISNRTHIYTTKVLVTERTDSWKVKTAQIGKLASENNRGCILGTSMKELADICTKYGGVIQDIRTGEILLTVQNGSALVDWQIVGKFVELAGGIKLWFGYVPYKNSQIRLFHKRNGRGQSMTFIRHVTDIPEVIELLGECKYVRAKA